jgi:putative ABC transport system ATP-binding protein
MAQETIIDVRDLVRVFDTRAGERRVLVGADLAVERGEMVCVVGRSGAGKSTFLHILAGLDRGFQGRVSIAGRRLAELSERAMAEYRARTTGVVFQGLGVLDHLNVRENVMLSGAFRSSGGHSDGAAAEELLERVGLGGRGDERPTDFSGGERQRLMLARALFGGPEILLCDEMTGQLDEATAAAILDVLGQARRDLSLTIVAVTHNEVLVRQADRVVRLSEGRLVPGDGTA